MPWDDKFNVRFSAEPELDAAAAAGAEECSCVEDGTVDKDLEEPQRSEELKIDSGGLIPTGSILPGDWKR